MVAARIVGDGITDTLADHKRQDIEAKAPLFFT